MDRRWHALGDLRVLPDELLCAIVDLLTPADLGRLACASSVLYILCNEEPLWMSKALSVGGLLEFKGSWKKTALCRLKICSESGITDHKVKNFDGFSSLFLYRRWYRRFTKLSEFQFDIGHLERKENLSSDEFHSKYDGKRPVLITKLAESWSAKTKWTMDQLSHSYGDVAFRISQRSNQKITMRLKDYVTYMEQQHDEDPLYVFDDKFGESASALLEDYNVPHLFQEDFFDVLNNDQRPSYRWLIIGPERSGASWHVDPGLTSAWNTLLSGRKRWALYPPGRVPAGVTVHVNEDDGDVFIDTPTSLQWWLEFYPGLAEHDKPLECTQQPGETIFVPSGWWHCVINLEETIAVTQNFVNQTNFEFVCLDMAPGYVHKGVSRAGLLAVPDGFDQNASNGGMKISGLNHPDMTRKEKRLKYSELSMLKTNGDHKPTLDNTHNVNIGKKPRSYSYDIDFLSIYLEKHRDHYSSTWSPSNYIGPRDARCWLHKLWFAKHDLRPLIWKGACLAINADKWYACLLKICACHKLPSPLEKQLPVGNSSNPVFVLPENVIKIYAEEGFESAVHSLGTELEFYDILRQANSSLIENIPEIVGSGFLICENGFFKAVPWDGKGVPKVVSSSYSTDSQSSFPFGVWSKMRSKLRDPTKGSNEMIFPYLVMRRCKGQIFADMRNSMSKEDAFSLASSLGALLRTLHLLPLPDIQSTADMTNNHINLMESISNTCPSGKSSQSVKSLPLQWEYAITLLEERRKKVKERLEHWGEPIPQHLINVAEDYLPSDLNLLLDLVNKDGDGNYMLPCVPSWVHSDIMDDNIVVTISSPANHFNLNTPAESLSGTEENDCGKELGRCITTRIIDFSDMSLGHPITDLIPIHLDVFKGESALLQELLKSYKLPLSRGAVDLDNSDLGKQSMLTRLSYRAMCYCILHEENVLGAIFSLRKELRSVPTWSDVEEAIWGELNSYNPSC